MELFNQQETLSLIITRYVLALSVDDQRPKLIRGNSILRDTRLS